VTKPQLTVEKLLRSGFGEVGCWELNSARDLVHNIDLPTRAGVYAFAIDGVVQYVGLASKSIRQRLGFYRKPGASQRTNIRLNDIIRTHIGKGAVVQILIAHPPDQVWNEFKISGAEGLEAGIIADFNLPWNMRGAGNASSVDAVAFRAARQARAAPVADKIVDLVRRRPGMTELEIAKALFGPAAMQQQVNQQCRALLKSGRIVRLGSGGGSDPYTYHQAS
jgi:hypothetical protein